jgi:hypothetical protein
MEFGGYLFQGIPFFSLGASKLVAVSSEKVKCSKLCGTQYVLKNETIWRIIKGYLASHFRSFEENLEFIDFSRFSSSNLFVYYARPLYKHFTIRYGSSH